jgi:hypothetical protein
VSVRAVGGAFWWARRWRRRPAVTGATLRFASPAHLVLVASVVAGLVCAAAALAVAVVQSRVGHALRSPGS